MCFAIHKDHSLIPTGVIDQKIHDSKPSEALINFQKFRKDIETTLEELEKLVKDNCAPSIILENIKTLCANGKMTLEELNTTVKSLIKTFTVHELKLTPVERQFDSSFTSIK